MRAPSPLAPVDPETAGPFRLLGRLAAGGMGDVYLGREADRPDSLVAVKLLRRDLAHDPAFRARFEAEVKASFRVARRPSTVTHVARVVAADVDADPAWLATEFVPGPTVGDAAADAPLHGERLHDVARSLAEALAAMHAEGLVHGDVKPANVVLGPDGVRLVDLGLAHDLDDPPPGPVMGSPGWSPPERGRALSRPAGDVHGWGLTVAYAATGRHPFGTGAPEALARRMRTSAPDLAALPEPLRGAVLAALDPDHRRRPRAEELALLLAQAPVAGATVVLPEPLAVDATGPLLPPTSVDLLLDDDHLHAPDHEGVRGERSRAVFAMTGVAVVLAVCLGLWLLGVALLQPPPAPASEAGPSTPAATSSPSSAAPSPTRATTTTTTATKAAAPVTGKAPAKATGKGDKNGKKKKGEGKG